MTVSLFLCAWYIGVCVGRRVNVTELYMQILADRALIDESDGACRERLLRLRALRDLAELLCVVLHNSITSQNNHMHAFRRVALCGLSFFLSLTVSLFFSCSLHFSFLFSKAYI